MENAHDTMLHLVRYTYSKRWMVMVMLRELVWYHQYCFKYFLQLLQYFILGQFVECHPGRILTPVYSKP
jgi:hypothetical protein